MKQFSTLLFFFFLLGNIAAQAQDTINTDSTFFRRRNIRELVYVRNYAGLDSFSYRFDERGKLREYLYAMHQESRTIKKYVAFDDAGKCIEQRYIDINGDTNFLAATYHNGERTENHVWLDLGHVCSVYEHGSDSEQYFVQRTFGESYFQYWEFNLEGCYDQTFVRSDTTDLVRSNSEERTIIMTEQTPRQQFLSQTTCVYRKGTLQVREYGEPVLKDFVYTQRTYKRYDGSQLEERYSKYGTIYFSWPMEGSTFGFNRYEAPPSKRLMQQPGLHIRHKYDETHTLRPACSYERFAFTREEP